MYLLLLCMLYTVLILLRYVADPPEMTQPLAGMRVSHGSTDSHLHVVEPPIAAENCSSGKLESTHPSRTIVKFFFIESSQLCSTETLTTGPDFDPLLLLIALAGDVHPNPGPLRYPARSASRTSLANVPATCVQDACIGYIQDVLGFETLRFIVEPMA